MINKLKKLLDFLSYYKKDLFIRERNIDKIDDYIFALKCAIEILEDIRINERSIQNGNIK